MTLSIEIKEIVNKIVACTTQKLNMQCEYKYLRNISDVFVVPYLQEVLHVDTNCDNKQNCNTCDIIIGEAQNKINLIYIIKKLNDKIDNNSQTITDINANLDLSWQQR